MAATITIDNIETGNFTKTQLKKIIKNYIAGITVSAKPKNTSVASKLQGWAADSDFKDKSSKDIRDMMYQTKYNNYEKNFS